MNIEIKFDISPDALKVLEGVLERARDPEWQEAHRRMGFATCADDIELIDIMTAIEKEQR